MSPQGTTVVGVRVTGDLWAAYQSCGPGAVSWRFTRHAWMPHAPACSCRPMALPNLKGPCRAHAENARRMITTGVRLVPVGGGCWSSPDLLRWARPVDDALWALSRGDVRGGCPIPLCLRSEAQPGSADPGAAERARRDSRIHSPIPRHSRPHSASWNCRTPRSRSQAFYAAVGRTASSVRWCASGPRGHVDPTDDSRAGRLVGVTSPTGDVWRSVRVEQTAEQVGGVAVRAGDAVGVHVQRR